MLRRSTLSESEAALLREVFPAIFAAHYQQIWRRLHRRGLEDPEIDDLEQEAFLTLYDYILERFVRPDKPLVEEVQTDPEHAKALARQWLEMQAPAALREIEKEIAEAEAKEAAEKEARKAVARAPSRGRSYEPPDLRGDGARPRV